MGVIISTDNCNIFSLKQQYFERNFWIKSECPLNGERLDPTM